MLVQGTSTSVFPRLCRGNGDRVLPTPLLRVDVLFYVHILLIQILAFLVTINPYEYRKSVIILKFEAYHAMTAT